ncbi:MAG: UDP-N-acetylglucosamine 1-carboxyvinyltransferase [Clostridia bacterium]|nr:MAG: UDP-N-acetylglucosamine 1-carboxyvinyltransferase [Clostridia bacterium]
MASWKVRGGRQLIGRVRISGSKNAALAVLAASVLATGPVVLENIPRVQDVEVTLNILHSLGVGGHWEEAGLLRLEVPEKIAGSIPFAEARRIRASSLLLGALLAKKGEAHIPLPGGCNIGLRPLDLHLKGLAAMGAAARIAGGQVLASGHDLHPAKIYLDFPSVGATENLVLAACRVPGQTIIENAAKEPEIVDLASFLNAMGAHVRGAGTDVIRVEGGFELGPARHTVIPDRIEAGTYMLAAVITRGRVTVENVIPLHLQPVTAKIQELGARVEEAGETLTITGPERVRAVNVKTMPYPGFPTDLQSPMLAVLALAAGTGVVVETVFENRYQVAEELQRMGAQIKIEGQTAVVIGQPKLWGAEVRVPELRGGAALLLAALAAEGESRLTGVEGINRGYEDCLAKMQALGAEIVSEVS